MPVVDLLLFLLICSVTLIVVRHSTVTRYDPLTLLHVTHVTFRRLRRSTTLRYPTFITFVTIVHTGYLSSVARSRFTTTIYVVDSR